MNQSSQYQGDGNYLPGGHAGGQNVGGGGMRALPGMTGGGSLAVPDFGSPQGAQQTNIIKLLHQLFRGRYPLTLLAAAVCFVLGAAVAWFLNKPVYESQSTIRIQPLNYDPISKNPEVLQMYDSLVRTHAVLIQQPRVLSKAMSSREWQDLHLPSTPAAERDFKNALSVKTDRSSPELISVKFSHPDAKAAFVGLTQVCQAYNQIFAEGQDQQLQQTKARVLADEKNVLDQRIRDTLNQIKALAEELGSDEPAALMDYQNRKLIDIDAQVYELENRLIAAGGVASGTGSTPSDDGTTTDKPKERAAMTYEEIAGVDGMMGQYLVQYNESTTRRDQLRATGLGDNHVEMKKLEREINRLVEAMEVRRKAWVDGKTIATQISSNDPSKHSMLPSPIDTVDSLHRRLRELKKQREFVQQQSKLLAGKKQELEIRRQQVETDQTSLTKVKDAIDAQRREQEMMRQIERVQMILPERPENFASQNTRLRNGVLFGGLAAMIPVTLVALYGLIDRRYRYSDEAIEEGPRNTSLLGILPRLPADLHDAEQAAAAAHCVHQIRALVQLGGGRGKRVFAVTSSNPGDGKTSMALSLGYSYAGSGAKTLLVDMDLIGQGLSRSMKMREQSGLYQAILDGNVRPRVRETHMPNLSMLPTGLEDDHRSANRLSEQQVSQLIESVRDDFDVVLIDTGPVLGSIEAHLVCAQVDGVILVVGAGRARGQVKYAVDQLNRVGARLLGLVFNLAQGRDFKTSAASQSFRSVRPDGPPPQRPDPGDFPELEPLPRVVAIDTRR